MPFRDIASPMKRYGPLAKIHNLRSYGLCVFGRRGRGRGRRTRTLCIRRTLCRHVTIGTPTVIFAVFTVF